MLQKIKNIILSQRTLLFIGSVLIGVASIFHYTEWLLVPALVPFFYYVDKINNVSKKTSFIDFYVSGITICCLSYIFLLELEPTNWDFAFTGWFGVIAGITAWLLASSFSAVSFLLIPLFLRRIQPPVLRLVMFPFALVLAEIVRSYLFSIISYGPGSELGLAYNWGSLAVISSNLPLVYGARIVGFYGLTILAGLIVASIYLVITKHKFLLPASILFLIVGICFVGYLLPFSEQTTSTNVVAAHLNESDTMLEWENFDSLPNSIDLLVLPEYSEITLNNKFSDVLGKLNPGGVIVTTVRNGESPNASNDLIYIDEQNNEISRQSKNKLIPAGEYLPFSLAAAFKLMGKEDSINLFKYSQQLQPGDLSIDNVKSGNVVYGALPCSGILSPNSYRELSKRGADVLVNPASLALLKNNSRYHIFAKRMARYHAVNNNRPFIQASRSGESYIIGSNGNILSHSIGIQTQIVSHNEVE